MKSSMEKVYQVLVKIGVIPKKKFLQKKMKKEFIIFITKQHVLVTLFKSVKILENCYKP